MEILSSPVNLPIYCRGPALEKGMLPAFFYFALSGEDSLYLDPYNQPLIPLDSFPVRTFSFSLPFHETGKDYNEAMKTWIAAFTEDTHLTKIFFDQCLQNIQYLIDKGYVDPERMAVGGLSRGGFVATHLAALDPRLKTILGFAPMTKLLGLEHIKEMQSWNLAHLIPQLVHHKLRFYIGNRDERVSTESCFEFIHQLSESAYQAGYRSPPVELIISPSVGHKGHGTLPPTFTDGGQWIIKNLNI